MQHEKRVSKVISVLEFISKCRFVDTAISQIENNREIACCPPHPDVWLPLSGTLGGKGGMCSPPFNVLASYFHHPTNVLILIYIQLHSTFFAQFSLRPYPNLISPFNS